MRKLEDIPKKDIFTTPEGYFDKLPGMIEARVAKKTKTSISPAFAFSLKYALPVVVFLAAGIFWYTQSNSSTDVDRLLSVVQTEDLVAYLNDSDMSTEEVIESADFSVTDIHEIEEKVYNLNITNEDIQKIVDDLD